MTNHRCRLITSTGEKTQKKSADVYSFGVILWELFTGYVPWSDMEGVQIMADVGFNGERLSIPAELAQDNPVVSDLITACFRDEAKRPTFHELFHALDRLLTHAGSSSSGDMGIAGLSQKMDVFIKLSKEQFELVSDLHAGSNLMPHTYMILPRLHENTGLWKWISSSAASLAWDQSRLHFFCPVTWKLVPCGVDGDGYPLSIPREWLTKLAPALQFGVSLLKVLVVTGGLAGMVDLSSIVPAGSTASGLEALGKIVTGMKKIASGIEDATGEDPLDFLAEAIEGLSADEDAKNAHALVYRFLAKAELDGADPYPGWKPQLTGLGTEAITPVGGGKSLWVSPEGRDAYLRQGKQAVQSHRSDSPSKASGHPITSGPATATTTASTQPNSTQHNTIEHDAAMAEIASMRSKAEIDAIEIKAKAERDAKEQADRTAAAMAKAEQEIAEMKAKAGQELQQQRQRQLDVRVSIAGVTGPQETAVNGVYEPTSELSGGMPVYRKVGDGDRWLWFYAPKSQWQVTRTANMGTGLAAAYCVVPLPCMPQDCPVGMWQVSFDGTEYVPQPAIIVSFQT